MPKKLIYSVGVNAGFFSEINSMLIARLYCYDNNIDFCLYSKKANFAYSKGWADYFEPFCEENAKRLHSRINFRRYKEWPKNVKKAVLGIWRASYKLAFPNVLLTEDIWLQIRSLDFISKKFNIPALSHDRSDIYQMLRILLISIWKYNKEVSEYLRNELAKITPQQDYCSIHVRRGDKVKESSFYPLSDYIDTIPSPSISHVFVATDDYTAVEELRLLYPHIVFFTNCIPEQRGYMQKEFNNLGPTQVRQNVLNLLLDIELIKMSKHFCGTMSSNIGLFIALYKNSNECSYIDTRNKCFIM